MLKGQRRPVYKLLRYSVGYVNFCILVQKGAVVTLTIYGITRPNVTKIVYNVEQFILFNILKSVLEWQ